MNKDLIDALDHYTKYSNGDTDTECKLEYSEIAIDDLDFSPYDLGSSIFVKVRFNFCNFTEVYLSSSNFTFSSLKDCEMNDNDIVKASWDNMKFEHSKISMMHAFRTTFISGMFQDTNFNQCEFNRCLFNKSEFENIYFMDCTICDTDFSGCTFQNVHFVHCKMENNIFDKRLDKQSIFIE